MEQGKLLDHAGSQVAAAHGKAFVAKLFGHQLEEEVGDASHTHSRFRRSIGKAIARQRWYDHIKGISRVAAMALGMGQHRNNLHHLYKRAGPSMQQHQWEGVRARTTLMDEVNANAIYRRPEMVEGVDPLFLLVPLETLLPVP